MLVVGFVSWLFCVVVGAAIGAQSHRAGLGALMGGLLGPFGWLVALFFSDRPEAGRETAEVLRDEPSPGRGGETP